MHCLIGLIHLQLIPLRLTGEKVSLGNAIISENKILDLYPRRRASPTLHIAVPPVFEQQPSKAVVQLLAACQVNYF